MTYDLVGTSEIAEMAGVGPTAVSNWVTRYPSFPKPVVVLKATPVFRRLEVTKWLEKTGRLKTK